MPGAFGAKNGFQRVNHHMGSRGGEEEPSALFEEEETDPSLANSSEKVCVSTTPNTKQAHGALQDTPIVQSSLA